MKIKLLLRGSPLFSVVSMKIQCRCSLLFNDTTLIIQCFIPKREKDNEKKKTKSPEGKDPQERGGQTALEVVRSLLTVYILRRNSIFLKKCKNGLKNGVLPKKVPLFWAKWDWPFIFGQCWPNFLFLPEICLFGLSFYETTRFFWKNVKMG